MVAKPVALAPFERPEIICLTFLAISVMLMAGADYPLGVWMKAFPQELIGVADWITDLGEGVQVLLGSAALLILSIFLPVKNLRRRIVVGANAVTAAAGFVFLAVAGGGMSSLLLKYAIGRARPYLLDSHGSLNFQPFAFQSDFSAFPSGHSATAGAMAMSLALVFPRLRSVLVPIGVLICLSRQLVGAHWISDTIMGWGVGVAFTFWLAHVFARRRLMFVYDADGCLRRKSSEDFLHRVWPRTLKAAFAKAS